MTHKLPLVIGNWKLNPSTALEAKTLYSDIKKRLPKEKMAEVVIAPPFLFIPELSKLGNDKMILGAQDAHFEERGAVTGEIGPGMLANYGVSYVIVGHSERRALGETDIQVNKKIKALLKRKLTPVVCVGERKRDVQGLFFNDVANQIKALAVGLTVVELTRVVIAYEPIWAIGTGETATVDNVKEMQIFIKSTLTKLYERKVADKVTLLYGGSVKASNAKELHQEGGMNGFLVGGASLLPAEFVEIIKSTNK
ncbi:MAG TPA: triose-phosphate isomerase [Candidatus Paceibacterota bacterium]|nr:triose-phosphate isomerase [Candidatus Paceibacterota bacterium]